MEPSLPPDLAHLPMFIATCFIAACAIGLGSWIGARRVETALIAGWGVACFATVVIGTLTNIGLSRVMAALGVAGIAGLVRISIAAARGRGILRSGMAMKIAVLALPFAACIEGAETIAWDDFSHWLPNLSYLCEHDHFPTLTIQAMSDHAGYPYAIALPGFAVFLLLGAVSQKPSLVPDGCAIYWNAIAMLAACTCIATILAERLARLSPRHEVRDDWSVAAIGLLAGGLASPTFVPKIFLSNMADAATGSVLAVLGALFFEWMDAPPERRQRIALVFAAGCVLLIDLRQANVALFGLLVAGCILAWWRHRDHTVSGTLRSLAIAVLPALLTAGLWTHYAQTQIPGGQLGLMPFAEWRWTRLPETLRNMLRIMIAKTGLFLLTLLISLRAALGFRRTDRLSPSARGTLIVSAVVCIGMISFLAFTYLAAEFRPEEATAATSFWRYMGEVGPLAVLAAVTFVPLVRIRRAVPVVIAIALILPVATAKFYRDDLTSPVPALRAQARQMRAIVPREAPLLLVDLTGNGFAVLVVTYEMMLSGPEFGLARRPMVPISDISGISARDAAKIDFRAGEYIWLAEGAPEMDRPFGMPLSAGCSYLLKREAGTFAIAERWRIGRYKWGSYRDGWSATTEAACH